MLSYNLPWIGTVGVELGADEEGLADANEDASDEKNDSVSSDVFVEDASCETSVADGYEYLLLPVDDKASEFSDKLPLIMTILAESRSAAAVSKDIDVEYALSRDMILIAICLILNLLFIILLLKYHFISMKELYNGVI